MTKENKEANVGEVRVKERNATTTESVKSLHCRTLWSFSRPTVANVKQRARNEQWELAARSREQRELHTAFCKDNKVSTRYFGGFNAQNKSSLYCIPQQSLYLTMNRLMRNPIEQKKCPIGDNTETNKRTYSELVSSMRVNKQKHG